MSPEIEIAIYFINANKVIIIIFGLSSRRFGYFMVLYFQLNNINGYFFSEVHAYMHIDIFGH